MQTPPTIIKKTLLFIVALILTLSLSATEPKFTVLNGKDYYQELVTQIQQAKTSIHVAIYMISLPASPAKENKVLLLLNEIIQAKNRGVKIKLILDYTPSAKKRSIHAKKYLEKANIPIFEDEANLLLHSKDVVIDSNIVFTGSANWSTYAFERNEETVLKIEDTNTAATLLNKISKIKLQNSNSCHIPTFNINAAWLDKDGILLNLYSTASRRQIDLLLALCYLSEIQSTIDEDILAPYLGLQSLNRNDLRRAITRAFRKLEKTGILRFQTGFNKPFHFLFNEQSKWNQLKIPQTYFEYNWDKTLSTPALIQLLLFFKESNDRNELTIFLKEFEQKYQISNQIVIGRNELKHYHIITVEYSEAKESRHELPSKIIFNGFYSLSDRKQEIKALQTQFPELDAEKAMEYAAIINEENNPIRIKDILLLMKKDPENLDYAFQIIKNFAPDNHRRSMKYVIGIMKNRVNS